jgi:hypothetical protein
MQAHTLPECHRSEAFAEDVMDLVPARQPVRRASRAPARSAWLLLVPVALALAGVCLVLAGVAT